MLCDIQGLQTKVLQFTMVIHVKLNWRSELENFSFHVTFFDLKRSRFIINCYLSARLQFSYLNLHFENINKIP